MVPIPTRPLVTTNWVEVAKPVEEEAMTKEGVPTAKSWEPTESLAQGVEVEIPILMSLSVSRLEATRVLASLQRARELVMPVKAVTGEVPLPLRMPVRVVAPVPPLPTGRAVVRERVPRLAAAANKLVEEAVVEKKLVVVALVPVAFTKVKF